ncbi:MBL fold metallo-hydrolase RNA specificity domain-containing protein [Schaalia hyovaginalis]|uniref:MBL fold metallo-hydrolase RNA specificity domain-containing protein n=1 Tax=Schaalia hyovaginalis TaxID=29316 RepID=UPI0026F1E247|nr:MBL fold metallo-hydrolase [Schaalia hyovaginalis]MDD7553744.1 MBL fold metallo-hydrolase [Schaalia hyovaginalis]MDY3093568.1 MBL fold metallo-hydrolase [Schaalia hyovaginalis]
MGATTLTLLGGAGTVTGSKYLVEIDTPDGPRRLLVDAGMFQGIKRLRLLNWSDFPVPPASITDVLLTHAHMDHTDYLPRLVRNGFSGAIWGTDATLALAEIVLRDSAHLQERDAEYANAHGFSRHEKAQPLYRIGDVERTLPLFRSVEFDRPLDLGDGLEARWTRAGHILGSGSIRLATPDGSILFSGDLGRSTHPVLRSREIPEGADLVLVESTYGDREHPEPEGPAHEVFAEAIRSAVEAGGSVLVPAFAVDRTEVVLLALDGMSAEGRIPRVPVFVDSPMALASLEIYRARSQAEELSEGARGLRLPHLELHELRSVDESKSLNALARPSIIISASGMATGGRVLHHLARMLPDERNCIVLTGYQAAGTRDRSLAEGAPCVKMLGTEVAVRARIVKDEEFSVHADASELIDWVGALRPRPRKVLTVHGEKESAEALALRLAQELDLDAQPSSAGQIIPLPLGQARRPRRR